MKSFALITAFLVFSTFTGFSQESNSAQISKSEINSKGETDYLPVFFMNRNYDLDSAIQAEAKSFNDFFEGRKPSLNIISISHTYDLSEEDLERIKATVNSFCEATNLPYKYVQINELKAPYAISETEIETIPQETLLTKEYVESLSPEMRLKVLEYSLVISGGISCPDF